ncbi:MAG: VWA domain-containing protein [Candidatus Woesearchaeota archaeon]
MFPNAAVSLDEAEPVEELKGKLSSNFSDQKLMHTVLEGDKEHVDDGKLILESINQGLGSFSPDLMFENMVKNYSLAQQLYGERLIQLISGYDARYVENNIRIPEFRRELKRVMEENFRGLTRRGFVEDDGSISGKGLELASLILYVSELDNLLPHGFAGDKPHKRAAVYGEKSDLTAFRGQRYRDIALRKSLKLAIRRGHSELGVEDLQAFKRKSKGQIFVVYALDSSGSMKGKKIEECKKAGVGLAYRAIHEKDNVGLIVFGDKVKHKVGPTQDFVKLLKTITGVRAANETDLAGMILHAVDMFPDKKVTKHLILITDALPTVGNDPEKATMMAVSRAKAKGITISLVGIGLDQRGEELAKQIVALGKGRLYAVRNLEDIGGLVLEDYYSVT